jgi:hypothetical protein
MKNIKKIICSFVILVMLNPVLGFAMSPAWREQAFTVNLYEVMARTLGCGHEEEIMKFYIEESMADDIGPEYASWFRKGVEMAYKTLVPTAVAYRRSGISERRKSPSGIFQGIVSSALVTVPFLLSYFTS